MLSEMRTRAPLILVVLTLAGCGKTEQTGSVGQELTAKGLRVTLEKVDTAVPVPGRDITGLSTPSPGFKLVGVRVQVCSNHGGATGPYDFGVKTTDGETGRLKFPAMNYPDAFESRRGGCGRGWVVFEIPRTATLGKVTYGFDDTGSYRHEQNRVSARFTWNVNR